MPDTEDDDFAMQAEARIERIKITLANLAQLLEDTRSDTIARTVIAMGHSAAARAKAESLMSRAFDEAYGAPGPAAGERDPWGEAL